MPLITRRRFVAATGALSLAGAARGAAQTAGA